MMDGLRVPVGNLIGPGSRERSFSGEVEVRLKLGETSVMGPMAVVGVARGHLDSVEATFRASAEARLTCVRCLAEWAADVSVEAGRYFGRIPDEDGYLIEDGLIDVAPPAVDELALSLPVAPVCRPDCKGLCPTCGTDLNTDPCDGHRDDTDSPFAVLKDLFDS